MKHKTDFEKRFNELKKMNDKIKSEVQDIVGISKKITERDKVDGMDNSVDNRLISRTCYQGY
ncbi:hypothetical protein [Gluconacetobacter diazotrophicus]|uniref:hypothetical protein n=1 Tax=Gluconacetobacter diazotrophicus TaxID=33996 RepID=UPI0012FE9445|nr:hypothetical protein [Gluconacetobacter diazotrophicus]